ncbi:hypothetical protein [Maribacter arcticus]|uniref:hypothetical protein n=1 Tax=Maribacter arcticus TaxID=561365 RepID=UPI00300382D2
MKTSILLLFLLFTAFGFCQEDNIHGKSTVYEAPIDPLVQQKLEVWSKQKFGMLIH